MTAMIYPTTKPSLPEQMVVARAEGPYIYDKQGKRYLEGMAGLWCTALGYGNEEIIEVAKGAIPLLETIMKGITENIYENEIR